MAEQVKAQLWGVFGRYEELFVQPIVRVWFIEGIFGLCMLFRSRPNYFACLPISSTVPPGEWASLLKYGTRGRLYARLSMVKSSVTKLWSGMCMHEEWCSDNEI